MSLLAVLVIEPVSIKRTPEQNDFKVVEVLPVTTRDEIASKTKRQKKEKHSSSRNITAPSGSASNNNTSQAESQEVKNNSKANDNSTWSDKKQAKNQQEKPKSSSGQKDNKLAEDQPRNTPNKNNKTKAVNNKKDEQDELDKLLNNLEKSSVDNKGVAWKQNKQQSGSSDKTQKGNGYKNESLSISEQRYIKNKIESNWNIPIGLKNVSNVLITIEVTLSEDKRVSEMHVVEKKCDNIPAQNCQILINGAMRAIKASSPLDQLDSKRYSKWKKFSFTFNPQNID
jgi:hypothetical protein